MQSNNTISELKKRLLLLSMAGLSVTLVDNGLFTRTAIAQLQYPNNVAELQVPAPEVGEADIFLFDSTQPVDVYDPNRPAELAEDVLLPNQSAFDELQRFFLNFNDAYLVYEPGEPGLQIAAQRNVLSYGWDWEVVELKPYLYAFRQANWDGFYWKVNTSRKEVYRVTNGTFGELGGSGELMNMTVDTVGSPESPERFLLRFVDAYLVRASDGVLQIATEGNVLSYGGDWEVVELQPYLFQLRQSVWKDFYWQVNTSREIAERVNDNSFGELSSGDRDDLDLTVEAVY